MERWDIEIWATENLKGKQPAGAEKYPDKGVCLLARG